MSISIQHLTYIHSDKEILFKELNLTINKGDHCSLVGNNGSGKSTLLKIISGQLSPASGTVVCSSDPYYIPQHFGQYSNQTIVQAMHILPKIEALHAILSGNVSTNHFEILNDDWNIEERAKAALTAWGLANKNLCHSMSSLSGGEKTRVFLAGMEIHSPSVILMDEPSNHLDLSGRERLYDFIRRTSATLLIVSHDRTLLNLLSTTHELTSNGIVSYGGNYNFYKEQKQIKLNALQQQLEEKDKELRLAKKIARETIERRNKQNVRGEKANIKRGVPRIVLHSLKSKSEQSTAKLNDIHIEKSENIRKDISRIRTSLPNVSTLKTDFNHSSLRTGKALIIAQDINFRYHDQSLWKEPLNFTLKSGERICIEGANGSGKTTLLRLMMGVLKPTEGTLTRTDFNYIYLDQEYSIIRNERTVYQQAEEFNLRKLPEHEVKIILNRYLFPASIWDQPCHHLSGGEKMRLIFCCLMIGNNTPDLFILDEPTNNLDIQNIEIITSTIKDYSGTVIVVSHDTYFKDEIGIERCISI